MKTNAILVFDIGKTNKKFLLYNQDLKILHAEEQVFEEVLDEDGYPCDDIARIEKWILKTCQAILKDDKYFLNGINFTTYGASMMYTDDSGSRLTPLYNYLKPMPDGIVECFYKQHGGALEFCRNTASPALGMLNAGLQILQLKSKNSDVFSRVKHLMHFPQYLSYLLTGQVTSEHTSIGCHTALWNFDKMKYHGWLKEEKIELPYPKGVETTFPARKINSEVPVGIGIHDSSASLVPYLKCSLNSFILVSTGTWCINMNPFNHSPLTDEQLNLDCLAYLSIQQKPVKSSRFFLGHIHDVNVKHLSEYFNVSRDSYKKVIPDTSLLRSLLNNESSSDIFFANGMPSDYTDRDINLSLFNNFQEAYHRLMIDLVYLTSESVNLIMTYDNRAEDLYITGGFANNPLFVSLMATRYCNRKVYVSNVPNSTSMGAALVIWKTIDAKKEPVIDLGLRRIEPQMEVVEDLKVKFLYEEKI